MGEELLSKLEPRLATLGTGGYERIYMSKGKTHRSSAHQLIAQLLDSMKVPYKTDVEIGRGLPRADFVANETFVFVDKEIGPEVRRALAAKKRSCVIVKRDSLRSDRLDHGIRVIGLEEGGGLQTIFLDDPSFGFDYAHILPKTEKCSVMHGHTSSALVEIIGRPVNGMVVDFAVAKDVVRSAVKSLDHKLFIGERYVTAVDKDSVSLVFDTVHGEFAIKAPRATTVLLSEEATVESLARELVGRIAPGMPENVTAVGVYVYEGLNKGSHVLARVHQKGAETGRRKR